MRKQTGRSGSIKSHRAERKRYGGWERGRYDYDGNGTLTGFRVFYEEGDTEVTLKFHLARFYWEQPFVMEIVPEK